MTIVPLESNPKLPPLPLVPTAPPQVGQAIRQAEAVEATVGALVVDCPAMYQVAAEELVTIRSQWQAIEAQRVHLKEPFLEGCRRIDAFFKVPLDRLTAAGEQLKSTMLAWKREEDARIERERQAALERERAERAELQRQQQEAAERQRRAELQLELDTAHAAAIAEDAQRTADALAAAGDASAVEAAEAARVAQEAADAEAREASIRAGDEFMAAQQQADDAQAALDLAEVAPPPMVRSTTKAAGIAGRKTWKLQAVDKRALVIAAGKAAEGGDDSLLAYLEVNESALNGIARHLKGAARVAGCTFHQVESLAATGRRS